MKLERLLLLFYLLVFLVCAWSPYDRSVWLAENLPIVILVVFLVVASRYFTFSKLSYAFMIVLPILHTIGGHYTFELVPFGYVTDLFGFERNHYDRVAHFSVGFFAYPIAEFVVGRRLIVNRSMVFIFSISVIFTVASLYEILEWWYALFADAEAGLAVLGSQGDIWDAQKDMLADGLGALFSASVYLFVNRKQFEPKGESDG